MARQIADCSTAKSRCKACAEGGQDLRWARRRALFDLHYGIATTAVLYIGVESQEVVWHFQMRRGARGKRQGTKCVPASIEIGVNSQAKHELVGQMSTLTMAERRNMTIKTLQCPAIVLSRNWQLAHIATVARARYRSETSRPLSSPRTTISFTTGQIWRSDCCAYGHDAIAASCPVVLLK